jgi:hypothetical protein
LGSESKPTPFVEPPPPPKDVDTERGGGSSAWRVLGWSLGGAGAISVATGGGLYIAQVTKTDPCSGNRCVASTMLVSVGAVAVIAGAIILVSSR